MPSIGGVVGFSYTFLLRTKNVWTEIHKTASMKRHNLSDVCTHFKCLRADLQCFLQNFFMIFDSVAYWLEPVIRH